jgi:uncharacterized protein (DUF1778 family)
MYKRMKDNSITFKVTKEQKQAIKETAKSMNMTVSGLILWLTLNFGKKVKE